jgi:hypothetical protein
MAADKLFGFSLEDRKNKKLGKTYSPAPPTDEDGVSTISVGGYYGHYLDIEGAAKNEFDLVKKYREVSLHPEVDSAIDEIVNEVIASDLDYSPVDIELSNLQVSDKIKKSIRTEFKYILRLLNFDKNCHTIFRRWYVDGKIFYHKIIDFDNPKDGIKELRFIDPLKIKKVREKLRKQEEIAIFGDRDINKYNYGNFVEYFIYSDKGYQGFGGQGIKIASDAVTFVPSGLMDYNKNLVLSYLHKAIKAVNQLRMIEDSLVIYRISRAPERRIFYIDVGNLPKIKAEQYLREVMSRYRNKLVYDSATGEVRDDRKHMSMLEDFWLPRREGGRGTEITTLPGGQNLGELADVQYFKQKLYSSLNLPISRLESGNAFSLGRSSEITRDELKFNKFVGRLRKRFSEVFHDILKTQLMLKGIITAEDWEEMKEDIQYDYIFDNHFSELKETELLTERMNIINMIEPYIGKYFSIEYARRQVLKQTDSEMEEIDLQVESEKELGLIVDPNAMMDQQMGMGGDMGMGGQPPPDQGQPPQNDVNSQFQNVVKSSDYNKGNF